ncbi:hypothetical protein [Cellulomonas shaoxiangyii]|uniref:DUF308 domain-containing protein n=1 Tax=Cellulomonas shaoxiangyii TaxID=2566013 RepID=A0A4P7SGR9_9CELL|nr:hypothetical protein [Cellulomonas shaoxiangyii]QCB92707.1 hypothetical protein E5225_03205 [Cellulomonas shaoxiangyii]TGY85832.1 hypothetical protein E5226_04650 [Cellulomonas shaoxiangyii]
MTTLDPPIAPPLALTLRRLSFSRFGFAVVWALLVALVAPDVAPLLTVLLIVYPLVDAASVLIELRASGASGRSATSEIVNIAVSVLAAIALGWASSASAAAVLAVWGVWAVLSGATQLLTGIGRRRALGGQWPVIVSGGLSVLVGFAFLAQGLGGATTVTSIAGYAALGGVLFGVSALRLTRSAADA